MLCGSELAVKVILGMWHTTCVKKKIRVTEYVPEFNLNWRLIHQGDYFFALDISKWKEKSISKNESSVALRV